MALATRARRAAAGVALLALAGCAGTAAPHDASQPSLAKACAVRPCRCLSTTVPFFLVRDSAPIRWLENGDASCPEGFKLVLSQEKR